MIALIFSFSTTTSGLLLIILLLIVITGWQKMMNSYIKRMLSNIKIVVLGIFIVCPQGNAI